jgi:hypothetical protein
MSRKTAPLIFATMLLSITCLLNSSDQTQSAEQCKTTLDCAQQAVEVAGQAIGAVSVLQARIDKLERDHAAFEKSVGPGRLLGSLQVKASKIVSSSYGLTFDSGTGVVTFPNPDNLKVVPVMSSISPNNVYVTESVYSRTASSPTQVTVWQGAQDTSGRNHAPVDFTLIIAGF